MERETRFELATFALARRRSTTEPFPHTIQWRENGGNNRARTYDPLLVRQMLSQLSYAPITSPLLIYYNKFRIKMQVFFRGFLIFFKIFFKCFNLTKKQAIYRYTLDQNQLFYYNLF